MTGKDIAMMTFVRPFQLMFLEPIVFALNLVSFRIQSNDAASSKRQ